MGNFILNVAFISYNTYLVTIVQALPGPPRLFQTNTGQGVWFQQKGGSAHGSNLIGSLGHVAKPAGARYPHR